MMTLTHIDRAWRARWWFAFLSVLVFGGEGLGRETCEIFTASPSEPFAWLVFAVVALMLGGVGALVLDALVLDPQRRQKAELDELQGRIAKFEALEASVAGRDEWQRRLRHDLRGALSPALLSADRLLTNEDPKVKRAGNLMVQAIERASEILAQREDESAGPV